MPEPREMRCACGAAVLVSADAQEKAATFNRRLAAVGEPPLAEREVARCPRCRHAAWLRFIGEAARDRAEVIRILRVLRGGGLVSSDVVARAKAGHFGDMLDRNLEWMDMASSRQGPSPSAALEDA
jgi:hypothetical protein